MKRWWIGLMLSILLVGCQPLVGGGETPEETSGLSRYARSGFQGLDMRFIQDLPPNSLWDVAELVIVNELKNVGSYNIEADKCFIEVSGIDRNIVRNLQPGIRQSCDDIEGKSVYNTEGGFNQIEFQSASIILPEGVDRYAPNIVLSACYNYKTIASPQVCIDPGFYQLTSEQKSCQVRDVPLGGGQGAPVSVDNVKVDMVGQKAIFQLDISNTGPGRVVSPRAALNQCPGNMRYDDFDEVGFIISLSGEFPEKCTPSDHLVRLTNNKGKVFCTFNVGSTAAYEAPLNIELNYKYLQSISKKVEIVKTPS
ncbi:MAG: hypothetical protein KAT77_02340 [Nanoarchaeota archaeon]|nr:hypothetical protein [Nanoarchaeota archaeon]